jgi:hypothetical protein
MTPDVPIAASNEASATTEAPVLALQSKVTCVVPGTTPTINVVPGTAVPAPDTVMLQGSGEATFGATIVADALPIEARDRLATMASADAPAKADVVTRRVRRSCALLKVFLMESPLLLKVVDDSFGGLSVFLPSSRL